MSENMDIIDRRNCGIGFALYITDFILFLILTKCQAQ